MLSLASVSVAAPNLQAPLDLTRFDGPRGAAGVAEAGNALLALSATGDVYRSADAVAWERAFAPVRGPVTRFDFGNGHAFGIAKTGAYYSADGVFWNFVRLSEEGRRFDLRAIGDWFVLSQTSETDSADVLYSVSKDLENWQELDPLPDVVTDGIAGSWGGTLALATGFTNDDSYFELNEAFGWDAATLPKRGQMLALEYVDGVSYLVLRPETPDDTAFELYRSEDRQSW